MSKIKINFKMPPESVAQKLYRRQQELRKKSGLPDPEEYKKRMQQYDKELGMKKESVYVDELPDTGGDSRNIKSVVSDVDPQKKKRMDDALAAANKTSEQPGAAQKIGEAGPFSYGAKPPRRNSLADQIAKKRQELQRKQPPMEPRDQMVGTAKVMRNEAAWGRDKMANLQAAHDRHSEKAIAANRAGDHEAVKVHQSKMGMIKTQMNKLRKEDVEQVHEAKHRVSVTVSEPDHPMVTKRKEQQQKFVRVSGEKEGAVARAQQHFKKQGYKIHGAEYVGGVNEDIEQVDELRTSTLLRYATKANKSLIGGDRNKEEKRIKGIQKANYKIQTRHKVKEDVEQQDEAWTQGNRNPQRGVKVGDKVRSYDFPGMHDDHYIEGHVVADNPHTYHIRVNKVVRSGKEIPVPAHMQHVEAPKGKGMFSNAYAVHKMMAKQQSVTAAPEPTTGAQKTFSQMRGKK